MADGAQDPINAIAQRFNSGDAADAALAFADLLAIARKLEAETADLRAELEYRETHCTVHEESVHGAEAEQLRRGIEKLIKEGSSDFEDTGINPDELQRLLDDVDACDSLAFLERVQREERGRSPLLLEEVERQTVERAMRKAEGNKTAAARLLGIDRKTLRRKLRAHGKEGPAAPPMDQRGAAEPGAV